MRTRCFVLICAAAPVLSLMLVMRHSVDLARLERRAPSRGPRIWTFVYPARKPSGPARLVDALVQYLERVIHRYAVTKFTYVRSGKLVSVRDGSGQHEWLFWYQE